MGRKAKDGGLNKSEAIREVLSQHPEMKVKEIVAFLAEKGTSVAPNLVYLIKGKMKGAKRQRMKTKRRATKVAFSAGNSDAVATIIKVKAFANEVGGLGALRAIVDALSS
jgi:hypothetical protein